MSSFPNSYVEALSSYVIVFGVGSFGRELGLDELIRIEPHDVTGTLIRG